MSNETIPDRIYIPASVKDREKIKASLVAMTHCMQKMDLEREAKKDLVDTLSKDFSIPKKTLNKLAATMYKRDYADKCAENEDFETLYETLVGSTVVQDEA